MEVARIGVGCAVRDSKDRDGVVLAFPPGEWAVLLKAIKAGGHDLP